jgi:hypothetical protein
MTRLICSAAGVLLIGAQESKAPAIVSPEVLPDGRVTLRFWAPKASEVTLSGDWMGPNPPVPLVKNEEGVWTATVGPLEPHVYTYGFIVDGVRASDPLCRCTLTWASRGASSRFAVPAPAPQPWDERAAVPNGTLHHEKYFSKHQQRVRRFVAYTPPDCATGKRAYPTLILLSGTPGDETRRCSSPMRSGRTTG